MSRHKVLLVSPPEPGSFVCQDFDLLQSEFTASFFEFESFGSVVGLWKAMRHVDAVLVWFAARRATPAILLARLMRIPVATIVGGYEVVWIPEIAYGIPPDSYWWPMIRWNLRTSNLVLTVSQASHEETCRVVPERASELRLIYNAVDTQRFCMGSVTERTAILTVARFGSATLRKKGLRLFWETASLLPEIRFVAVGPAVDSEAKELVAQCPPNLTWKGHLAGADLVNQFQRALVYVQASEHESFSLATAEAMACGCIPVVSRRGALPEVVGDTGVYLDSLTPAAVAAAIRTALKFPESRRQAARQRVIDRFSIDRRRDELCTAIRDMIAARHGRPIPVSSD